MICRASNPLVSYASFRGREEVSHWTGKIRESTRSGEVTFAAAQRQHPDIGLTYLGQEYCQVELRTSKYEANCQLHPNRLMTGCH